MKPVPKKEKAVSFGKKLSFNPQMWHVMDVQKYGDSVIITEVCKATTQCPDILMRTLIQKGGEIIHTSMIVMPRVNIWQQKDNNGNDYVEFTLNSTSNLKRGY